jgi:predicted acylesterase/phospholipase RssA
MNQTLNDGLSAPADRFCDLVMKGGITSGVVYPPAIVKLADQYRFKNIGGTSAGAIAAAVTSAAEFRRRQTGSMEGFKLLGALPVSLGQVDKSGDTQLFRLFQPDYACRRLFKTLTGSLNASGTFHRIAKVLSGCVTSYWLASSVSLIVSAAVGIATVSWHAGILILLVTLPALVGSLIYLDMTRGLVGNNYGMCKGLTTRKGSGPALTPWLHELIQSAAGLPLNEPLTFGHLWRAKGGPAPVGTAAVRSIDLEMFTTNLSHGRPYMFPHVEPTARLFYRREDLAPYLPTEVMKWFDDHAVAYAPNAAMPQSDPPTSRAAELSLKEIPKADSFPVLLAARMSLSFPLLFAAVPLWAIDYDHPRKQRDFQRCLFSDGGISSNFPMHLFDGLVPQWPTFGIDLEPKIEDLPGMTFLPTGYMQGIADRWTRFDAQPKSASRMGGFLMSIAGAMQNWNDNTQARSAGVRDRVVRVRLEKNEGGLNLNMPNGVIGSVAKKGAEAADKIAARFLGPPPPDGWDGWSAQRWARLDVFLYSLNQKVGGLLKALGPAIPHSNAYSALITQSKVAAPPGHKEPLTMAQAQALEELIRAIENAAEKFRISAPQYPSEPLPEPELRARSPL